MVLFVSTLYLINIMKNKKTLLMILDGWGIGDGSAADVISTVPTPNLDELVKKYFAVAE